MCSTEVKHWSCFDYLGVCSEGVGCMVGYDRDSRKLDKVSLDIQFFGESEEHAFCTMGRDAKHKESAGEQRDASSIMEII